MITHQIDAFLVRKNPHQVARYTDSATPGLGFYRVEMPKVNALRLWSLQNVGVVFVEAVNVSKEELAAEFAMIYMTDWPW